jgi:argininosuccinate lyase
MSEKQMELDSKMAYYDVWGTKAHVLMLHKKGIINNKEIVPILKSLNKIEEICERGNFQVDPKKGSQLTLDSMIINECGKIGHKVHTARSRNDQVMVTEILYLKDKMLEIIQKATKIQQSLITLSKEHIETVMPGYTHMQPAKPTTFGQWCLSYFDSLLRGISSVQRVFESYNMNPLGAVESYGTSWKIDRQFTAELLGFEKIWEIPIDVISSRGIVQLEYLKALSEIAITSSKISQDLLLFNTFEFGMIDLGAEVAQRMHPVTGSSVMAQKKNPDVLELIRSTAPQIIGFGNIVSNLLSALPTGYNRDSRETKEYIELGISKMAAMLDALETVLSTLNVDKKKMEQWVILNYSLTTDLADYIAQKNDVGYRLVYKVVGKVVDEAMKNGKLFMAIKASDIVDTGKEFDLDLKVTEDELKAIDPKSCISKRVHVGGSNTVVMNKMIVERENLVKNKQKWIDLEKKKTLAAKQKTNSLIHKILRENKIAPRKKRLRRS